MQVFIDCKDHPMRDRKNRKRRGPPPEPPVQPPPPPKLQKPETKLREDGTLDCIASDPGKVIKKKIIKEGAGVTPEVGFRVSVHYTYFFEGKKFIFYKLDL
jgi:hypothetical protein